MALTFEDVEDWTRRTCTLENLQRELSQRTTTWQAYRTNWQTFAVSRGGRAARPMRRASPSIGSMTTLPKAAAAVGAVRTQVGFNTAAVVAGLPELAVRK